MGLPDGHDDQDEGRDRDNDEDPPAVGVWRGLPARPRALPVPACLPRTRRGYVPLGSIWADFIAFSAFGVDKN